MNVEPEVVMSLLLSLVIGASAAQPPPLRVGVGHAALATLQTSRGWVDVPLSGVLLLDAEGVDAVSIVDPSVLHAVSMGNRVVLEGLVDGGRTDVVLQRGEEVEVFSVAVGSGGRTLSGVQRPSPAFVRMQVGQASLVDVGVPKSVAVVDPSILNVRMLGETLVFEAHHPGETDVLLGDDLQLFRVRID